ncbi:MAG TPA: cytochrome C oxidase subunit IV family protein [Candidatus Sulfopaludibacter sp.]|jgi:cytochrome c oxidase subunit 4|nr:cytochrome C oxidase subunit IV family protein [Candidatus Sulfopaludibacter sp.]
MSEHIDSVKTYVLVFAGLIFATLATTAVAFVDLGPFSVVVALAIAVCKMLLVALFFMHVRHSGKLTRLVLLGALMWLGILILMTLTDFSTRGLLGTPGR